MDKLYTVELTESQIRLLISGLGWMESECAVDDTVSALRKKLHDIVGPDEWEIRQAERAAGWDDQP